MIISGQFLHAQHQKTNNTGCAKNVPSCFCQNFVKSPLFGTQIAKTIESCQVCSLSSVRLTHSWIKCVLS